MRTWLLITVAALGLTSCMKKPDHTPDYGPEVEFTEIQKAANFDMPIAPETIKKGQRVSIDVYQVIDVQSPTTLWQRSDEVSDSTEDAGAYHWTFNVQLRERDEAGQWKVSEQPYGPFCWEKVEDNGACTSTQSQSFATTSSAKPSKSFKAYTLEGMREMDVQKPYKVTYHNLKREDGFLPVPQVVSNRPDCGGVKNCSQGLRYVRISFDIVEWTSETEGTRTNARFTYSSDIPTYIYDWVPGRVYFTNMVENCQQTWVEIKDDTHTQVVPVRECMEIRDFQFGSQ
jgi:hypothetical protein